MDFILSTHIQYDFHIQYDSFYTIPDIQNRIFIFYGAAQALNFELNESINNSQPKGGNIVITLLCAMSSEKWLNILYWTRQ